MRYTAGQYLIITEGAYLVQVIQPFDMRDVLQEYFTPHLTPREASHVSICQEASHVSIRQLVAWMVARGVVQEVPYEELHLGNYGTIHPALLQDG